MSAGAGTDSSGAAEGQDMTTQHLIDHHDRLRSYGVAFEGEQGPYVETEEAMPLRELAARGGRIVRVRWIGGDYIPGRGKCYDLSYVHGMVPGADGAEDVRVSITHLPAAFLVPRRNLKGALIDWAKDEGVFARSIGLLDEGHFSILG